MANIKLTANETRFVQAMNNSAGAVGRLSAELNIKLSRAMREADAVSRTFQQGIGKLGDKMANIGRAMTSAITVPLTIMSGLAAKAYGDIDQLKRALDVYGVSLEEIKKTAKLPGLGLKEAGEATINFLSVKYSAEQSNKAVREFGNALIYSGRGKEHLAGIATAFAQIKGKGKISAEEINQLAERLPMIRDLMQKAFGTADAEVLRKMKIGPDTFLAKLLEQLALLPRVSGGFKTAMENIFDSIYVGAYKIFSVADKLFNLTSIFNKISEWIDKITNLFSRLSPEAQKIVFVAIGITVAIGPLLTVLGYLTSSVIPLLISGAGMLAGVFSPVGLAIIAAVGVIAFAARQIIKHWDEVKSFLKSTGIWDGTIAVFSHSLAILGEFVMVFINFFTGDWGSMWENIKNIAKRAWNGIVSIVGEGLKMAVNLWKKVFDFLGFDSLVKGGDNAIKFIDTFTKVIKAKVPESIFTLQKLKDALTPPPGSGGGGGTGGGSGGDDAENWLLKLRQSQGWGNTFLLPSGFKELNKIKPSSLFSSESFKPFEEVLKAGENLKNRLPKILSSLDLSSAGQTIEQQIQDNVTKRAQLALLDLRSKIEEMTLQLKLDLVSGGLSGIGEAIGSAITGSGFDLSNIFKNILNTLGDFMINLGKQLLVYAKIFEGAKKLFEKNPLAGAVAMLVGGGIVKGLANSLFSQTPKLANGGIAYGPTMAMVGEYPGARANPEVITPVNKLTGMIRNAIGGGGQLYAGEVRLEGEAILISLNRHLSNKGLGRIG